MMGRRSHSRSGRERDAQRRLGAVQRLEVGHLGRGHVQLLADRFLLGRDLRSIAASDALASVTKFATPSS